jgi:hypothetical protein
VIDAMVGGYTAAVPLVSGASSVVGRLAERRPLCPVSSSPPVLTEAASAAAGLRVLAAPGPHHPFDPDVVPLAAVVLPAVDAVTVLCVEGSV